MTIGSFLLILGLIALNAFFTSVEFAVVTARRARLDLLAGSDSRAARIVRGWLDDTASRDRLIAATQLGITMASLALGAVGENAFQAWLEPLFTNAQIPAWLSFIDFIFPVLPLVLSLVIVTGMHVVLGEQVPKVAVLRAPERFSLAAAPAMQVFCVVFKFFIDLLAWATRSVLKLLGLPAESAQGSVYTLAEIKQMVSGPEVDGVIEDPEREMLSAVIDFGSLLVRQVYVPRTEIIAVENIATVQAAIRLAVENKATKLPMYENDLDHIIGIVYLHDLAQVLLDGEAEDTIVQETAREALFVPETISVNDLMHQFRASRVHMAIVLDEYGGTAGLVTLEDLLVEIVGEVQDAFDEPDPDVLVDADGTARIDGMTMIEEVNEHLGINLSDPDYDTIAGYVLGKLGHIPQVGESVEDSENHVLVKVEKMNRLRIEQVSLRRIP